MKNFYISILGFIFILFSSDCVRSDGTALIVDTTSRCVLEAVNNGEWTGLQGLMESKHLPQNYNLYNRGQLIKRVSASLPRPEKGPIDDKIIYRISFAERVKPGLIAIGNLNWDPLPRKVVELNPQNQTYQKIIRQVLDKNGLIQSKVIITQLLKVDIEGDGVDEVLISANHIGPNAFNEVDKNNRQRYASEGDYSFVLIRRVVKDQAVTELLYHDFHPQRDTDEVLIPPKEPITYSIGAIMDLNGDGLMETVISAVSFEIQWSFVTYAVGKNPVQHPNPTTYTVSSDGKK